MIYTRFKGPEQSCPCCCGGDGAQQKPERQQLVMQIPQQRKGQPPCIYKLSSNKPLQPTGCQPPPPPCIGGVGIEQQGLECGPCLPYQLNLDDMDG